MGAATRAAPALPLSPDGPEPVGDRGAAEHEGSGGGVALEDLRGKVTAPIFLLVPQVKLPKRLDLDRDAERALDSVLGLIAANWVEGRL